MDTTSDPESVPQPDPVDEAAASIDPRSPLAPEMIEEVAEFAQDLGRDVDVDDPSGAAGDRGGG